MATLAQLRSEPWWDREIVTGELDWLGDELCRRTGRPRAAFGSKGNTAHLKGAHRSQEWILNSRFCTSRTSTVQSGLTATQTRHIAGADFTPGDWGTAANRALMVEQTTRLRNALVRGQLAGVTQVIGTLNGRTVVGTRPDGSTFSSDDSHLDHWHLTFDRRRCADRSVMERVLAVALGEDDDMGELVGDQAKMLEATNERVRALAQLVETITTGWSSNPTGKESVPAVAALKAATKLGPALTAIQDHLGVIGHAITELAARPPAGTVVVTDEQLERVLRKIYGSVDGASPQG